MEGLTSSFQASDFAERLLQRLLVPTVIAEQTIKISTSIGISLYPQDGNDVYTLLKYADNALYRVKQAGKNHYQFYGL